MSWKKTAEICPLCGSVITGNYVMNKGVKVHESCTPKVELVGGTATSPGVKAREYMANHKRPKVDESKLKGSLDVVEKKAVSKRIADNAPKRRGRPPKKREPETN